MKESLINCFKDTIEVSDSILLDETEKAKKSNKIYKENFIAENRTIRNENSLDIFEYIIIESNTSFNIAKKYLQYGKTAVLNFANPHNPGGGVHNGATAQEECLCRSSNLYSCISDENVYEEYYLYNRNIANNFFSNRLIYTKDVTVFKDDSDIPQIMPKMEWFKVDVITCAAPYIAKRKYTNYTALKELFKGRIKNIFEAAIDNGVEVIILGAFGCGAFKNPPKIVAKAFHEVIDENNYSKYFKKIVFAIKSNYSSNSNYYAFHKEFFGEYETVVLEFPPLPLIEPLRSKCDESNDFMDYQEWKYNNKYHGKQFSILGDSISTLAGYNPKGYKVFYNGENCEKSGVKEMENTWWGKVIDFFGGELLVNNSWSGSRVTRLPNSEKLFPSGCSDERTEGLHIDNTKPDVIIIYLGTNDWAKGAEKHCVDYILTEDFHCQSFDFAYSMLITKLESNYPDSEIWCCTLNTTFMSSNPSFKFPYTYGGTHIEEYNQIIKDTANMHKCKVIDLYDYHIPYDSIDGSHPNADGMNTLATLMIREIGGKEVERFMDFENENNVEKVEMNFCSHCGNAIKLEANFCAYCGTPVNENSEFDICPNCNQRTLKHSLSSDYCTNCGFKALIYSDKSPYIWNPSNMNIDDIKCFGVSFGDCPNINISFDSDKLIVCNRINPRDGGMNFPDGFFNDKIVNLTIEQKESIINFIKTIDFSAWKTESHTIEMLELGACGFYISESFSITFNNGNTFVCHNPEYKEFNQLIDFLKSFCDNSWFELYYGEKVEDDTVLLEETYDSDADYVFLPSDMTRLLFDNTLKLFDSDANQNIEMQSEKIDVGRNSECDIHIDNNYISQIHASFYHEDSSWFIMDKGSTNGTWLNGKKLEQNTKYELYCDDVINFSKVKEYIFYKTNTKENKEYSEEELLGILEEAIERFHSNSDDTDALKIIALTMAEVPIYFPMDYDFYEMFGNIDPLQLKKGETITTTKDVKMKIVTLQVGDEEIVPMFTSVEQAHKGPDVNITRLYPQDYLPIVISMNKSFALNPFNNNAVSLKSGFLRDIVLPLVQEALKDKEEKETDNESKGNIIPIDANIGTVINDRYELLKLIGEGGMIKVYLAADKRLNKMWAVKVAKTDTHNNSDFVRETVLKEAKAMKLFDHPAIPRIAEIVVDSQHIAVVQDYVEGPTLKDILENYGAQPEERVIDWVKQVCDVLNYLHAFDPPYIYRDMKPGNLMLEPNGTIKLIDFGIMRTYKPNKTEDTCFLGTKGYAAPEQYGGRGQTDVRTDVYGLGMTMYHLLTGIDPQELNFSVKPICQINPNLPKGLEFIVDKCIQLDPANRYQSCTELLNDLNRYQSCGELGEEFDYLKENKKLKKRFKLFG